MTRLETRELPDRPRVLVVIGSYGSRNLSLLKVAIGRYKDMALDVDVKVVSNDPKSLGPGVEVIVGLPCKNPCSLPFAHKAVFAANLENYDYFVYSEDDIGITENNIRSFICITKALAPDEIAGFVRYEVNESGQRSFPDFHGMFRWMPSSVRRRDEHIVAEFSNAHSAFYVLSRKQLRQAIDSGGFLREPYQSEYDMLCSAATDPYTNCGFRKVLCVSSIADFMIHHLSNRYAGQVGASVDCFDAQIDAIIGIANGSYVASELMEFSCSWPLGQWAKSYYEKPSTVLLDMVPASARTVLSIGCGSGETETALSMRGLDVVAWPLDSIIGSVPARRGICVQHGTLDECAASTNGRVFDCVIATNLLHLVPDAERIVNVFADRVKRGGTLLIGGPNFSSPKVLIKRIFNLRGFRRLRSFDRSGVRIIGPTTLKRALKNLGMNADAVQWLTASGASSAIGRSGFLHSGSWLMRVKA